MQMNPGWGLRHSSQATASARGAYADNSLQNLPWPEILFWGTSTTSTAELSAQEMLHMLLDLWSFCSRRFRSSLVARLLIPIKYRSLSNSPAARGMLQQEHKPAGQGTNKSFFPQHFPITSYNKGHKSDFHFLKAFSYCWGRNKSCSSTAAS